MRSEGRQWSCISRGLALSGNTRRKSARVGRTQQPHAAGGVVSGCGWGFFKPFDLLFLIPEALCRRGILLPHSLPGKSLDGLGKEGDGTKSRV